MPENSHGRELFCLPVAAGQLVWADRLTRWHSPDRISGATGEALTTAKAGAWEILRATEGSQSGGGGAIRGMGNGKAT